MLCFYFIDSRQDYKRNASMEPDLQFSNAIQSMEYDLQFSNAIQSMDWKTKYEQVLSRHKSEEDQASSEIAAPKSHGSAGEARCLQQGSNVSLLGRRLKSGSGSMTLLLEKQKLL